MTALAGYWSLGAGADPAEACARMLQAQQVYGTEPEARWVGPGIAIGRRLWRLLPEDRFDRGPLQSADGAGVLAADLRLDNREELASVLGLAPAEAASLADAALLMKALERWGEGALDRIVGDFAFAWWQPDRRRLVLARDPTGQRPLHYHRGGGFFAFASMPRGLHALTEVPRRPHVAAVADFLALVPETGSETYFEGVEKVAPGEVLAVDPQGCARRSYWNPRPAELRLRRPRDYEEALREQLERAVAARLRGAGGRVAAHLSAGLDSAAVAATAARLLAPSGGRVAAFTAVPREGYAASGLGSVIADEGPLAASVAALHPNIDHVLIRAGGASPLAELGRNFALFERPYLNLCNGTWSAAILDEARRRRSAVLLTGMLGNATFSYHGLSHLHRLLRRGRLLRLAREAIRLRRHGTRLGTAAAQALGPVVPRFAWRALSRIRGAGSGPDATAALGDDQAQALGVARRAAERGLDFDHRPKADPLEARLWMLRRIDAGNYLKGTLAGWGIDQRDPATDRRLIEFCLSVPLDQYLAGGRPRSLARRAFADRLPPELVDEPRKGLQGADWHEGLCAARAEIGEEVEAIADCAEAAAAVDAAALRRLVEDWPDEGRWHDRATVARYRLALLRGISAGRFIRQALGANR